MGDDGLPSMEPIRVYENTYIMKPFPHQRFKSSAAEAILADVLADKMAFTTERDGKGRLTYQYDPDEARDVIQEIVAACQTKVVADMKARNNDQPPRYKLIFHASMGENHQQMMRSASRCLWDPAEDAFASKSWTNGKVWAVATCFALYYE